VVKRIYRCIDAHACGNPVRVITDGGPDLSGTTMLQRRQHFVEEFDWVRTGLMFEPRGHEIMSGSILYPTTRKDCDLGLLFIETSGCLPMCGHGVIGTVTAVVEHGLVEVRTPGLLRLDTPAGVIEAHYTTVDEHVEFVRIINVPSYLHSKALELDIPDLGLLKVDVAYGGNFYAIIEPQGAYRDLADLTPSTIRKLSPIVRQELNSTWEFVHPEHKEISGLSHVLWAGIPTNSGADGRNAVFYGDRAIDRSPCGTGTCARMAQMADRGDLLLGQSFVHESIIGTLFTGRIEEATRVGPFNAIIPSVEGWARITGLNTVFIDDRDPLAHGFLLD